MPLSRANLRDALVLVGCVWLGVFLAVGWAPDDRVDSLRPPNMRGPAGLSLASLPRLLDNVVTRMPRENLRAGIRAIRIGSEGGTLRCGRAQLVVPPNAVGRAALFCLLDTSDHMPAVELEHHATDMTAAVRLTLSYAGTPYDNIGYNPAGLQIYRQTGPDAFEEIPSRVSTRSKSVTGSVTQDGKYVIG